MQYRLFNALERLSGVFLRLCYKNQKAPKRLLVQKLFVIISVDIGQ